jgi:hypothetical protein
MIVFAWNADVLRRDSSSRKVLLHCRILCACENANELLQNHGICYANTKTLSVSSGLFSDVALANPGKLIAVKGKDLYVLDSGYTIDERGALRKEYTHAEYTRPESFMLHSDIPIMVNPFPKVLP